MRGGGTSSTTGGGRDMGLGDSEVRERDVIGDRGQGGGESGTWDVCASVTMFFSSPSRDRRTWHFFLFRAGTGAHGVGGRHIDSFRGRLNHHDV